MEKFMKYAIFFYNLLGIEPYRKDMVYEKEIRRTWTLYGAHVFNLFLVTLAESIYFWMAYKEGNIVEAVTVSSYIAFVVVGVCKISFIIWKKPQLSELMRRLEAIHPHGGTQEEAYKARDFLRSFLKISFRYSLLYSLLIWTFNLYPLGEYLVYEKILHLREVGKMLPYLLYIPWEWQDNWSYYLLLFSENMAGCTAAASQISTDLLICAVVTLIVMHFEHLANTLKNHKLSGDWKEDSRFLAHTVSYHESLLRLLKEINDLFGIPLLFNFMVSSGLICFVGFQMTVGVTPDMIFKLFLFLFSSTSQVYLISYYGQLVADAGLDISLAAYSQDWYHADTRYKRGLIIIICRAQEITYLKATIFLNITRSTFTELLQMSYKFFTLLRTIYAN
ncbi:hypothetical protein KR074_002999 [Drosophila pseudoananassae]|nr:hypothetical protein KR074_002999 [Drosophila pseudoananassae]